MEKYTGGSPWAVFPSAKQRKWLLRCCAKHFSVNWKKHQKFVKARHYQAHTFWVFSSIPSVLYPYLHDGHGFRKLFKEQLCSQNCTLLVNMHASAKLLLSFAFYKLFLTDYFPLFKQTMTFVTLKYISRRKVILWQKGPIF